MTLQEKMELYLEYKIATIFVNYDLAIYDLENFKTNHIFRNDIINHKKSSHYKTLNVCSLKYMEKEKISSFEEFCSDMSVEEIQRKNYRACTIDLWLTKKL